MNKQNNLNLATLVELYLERLETLNYSDYTLDGKRSTLGIFIRFCYAKGIQRPYQLTENVLIEFIEYTKKIPGRFGGSSSSLTIRNRFSIVRMFCDYLCKKKLLMADPSRYIETIPIREHQEVETFTKIQIEKIMSMPDIQTHEGIRDRAILETFYSTGLRRNELSALLLSDVHLHTKTIFVRKGKGSRDRMVPIGERACKWIEKYLSSGRPNYSQNNDYGYLFIGFYGTRISSDRLSRITRKYINKAKINKKGACHIFRHTAATHMLEGGAQIGQIQEFLGHAVPSTTEIYAHVSPSKLNQEYRRTHPALYMEPVESDETKKPRGRKIVMEMVKKRKDKVSIDDLLNDAPKDEFGKILNSFYEILKSKNYATSTMSRHIKNSMEFLNWCRTKAICQTSLITPTVIEDYQKYLTESTDYYGKPVSPHNQYDKAISLRVFFRMIHRTGINLHNPMDGVALPRTSKSLPSEVLTADEMEKVLASPNIKRPYGLRDRAIMELLYATAMRRFELATILIKDIDFTNRKIFIRGENERTLPLPERAVVWIQKYLKESRPKFTRTSVDSPIDLSSSKPLFLGSNGQAIPRGAITSICFGHIRKSGVSKRGSAQIFRRTAAVLMLDNGVELRTLQEYLGHKNSDSTQEYAKLNISKLREVHERTHPGANLRE